MRLMVVGDIHSDITGPRSRKDNYEQTGYRKLAECIHIATERAVDAVIVTGDFFHRKDSYRVPYRLTYRLLQLYDLFPVPVYCIAGNHDLRDGNISSLDGQPMGILIARSNRLKLCELGKPEILNGRAQRVGCTDEGYDVALHGLNGVFGIGPAVLEKVNLKPFAGWNILISHLDLYPSSAKVPYPIMRPPDFVGKGIDLLINGHIHDGYGMWKEGDMTCLNPGGLMRGSLRESSRNRKPSVFFLELGKKPEIRCEEIFLECVKPADEVFSYEYFDEKAQEEEYQKFIDILSKESSFTSSLNVPDVIRKIGELGTVDPAVMTMAKVYLESVDSTEEDRKSRYEAVQ